MPDMFTTDYLVIPAIETALFNEVMQGNLPRCARQSRLLHCGTSCVIPVGSWSNTPSKNCIVCHKTRPVTKAGALHTMK